MAILTYKSQTPIIGKNVYLAPSCKVIGDVAIGEDSSVWPMVVIRGDVNKIRIGQNTNIQDGSILHTTSNTEFCPDGASLNIGSNVTIGHQAVLHGCTIDDLCLIGIGSIVLDKAVVKKHALIAAGSLVPPGKIIEGGYLWMGSPVKRVRKLTAQEITYFAFSATHYVKLKNDYL